tara:strand:+ start:290 stop:466 length:177 start_codon:yes stop_codon:yes gene_type:complete
MSAWTDHVKKTYDAGRKKDSKYSYKQAMTDAKKTYKKGGSEKPPAKKMPKKKMEKKEE